VRLFFVQYTYISRALSYGLEEYGYSHSTEMMIAAKTKPTTDKHSIQQHMQLSDSRHDSPEVSVISQSVVVYRLLPFFFLEFRLVLLTGEPSGLVPVLGAQNAPVPEAAPPKTPVGDAPNPIVVVAPPKDTAGA
jgi:hypothetical protein